MSNSNKKTKPSARARKAVRQMQVPGGRPGQTFKNKGEFEAARDKQPPAVGARPGTPLNEAVPRPKVDLTQKAKSIIEREEQLKKNRQK